MSIEPKTGQTMNEFIATRAPERQQEHPEEDNQQSVVVAKTEFTAFLQAKKDLGHG